MTNIMGGACGSTLLDRSIVMYLLTTEPDHVSISSVLFPAPAQGHYAVDTIDKF